MSNSPSVLRLGGTVMVTTLVVWCTARQPRCEYRETEGPIMTPQLLHSVDGLSSSVLRKY